MTSVAVTSVAVALVSVKWYGTSVLKVSRSVASNLSATTYPAVGVYNDVSTVVGAAAGSPSVAEHCFTVGIPAAVAVTVAKLTVPAVSLPAGPTRVGANVGRR